LTAPRFRLVDLPAQHGPIALDILHDFARLIDAGTFISGAPISDVECALAKRAESGFAISCASGTDAIMLALMALGVGPGDAVLCPAHTYCASAEPAALLGAHPVFVDVRENDGCINPGDLPMAHDAAVAAGLVPRVVIGVDLNGTIADHSSLRAFCKARGMALVCDGAQSFGNRSINGAVGSLGDVTTTSFFPSKPLGCMGDGGAVFTSSKELADRIRSLKGHGQVPGARYLHRHIGLNSRLDALQAAVLLRKLPRLDREIAVRRAAAALYCALLQDVAKVPDCDLCQSSIWAYFPIRVAPGTRDAVRARLAEMGVETGIHYPVPLHLQPAFRPYILPGREVHPVSEMLANSIISLPMHGSLCAQDVRAISESVVGAISMADRSVIGLPTRTRPQRRMRML
jgi:dTDP-4-amino-4,6-dideoxygalactose transaminase